MVHARGGARGQNLGHIKNVLFTYFFSSLSSYLNKNIGMFSFLDHRYHLESNYIP